MKRLVPIFVIVVLTLTACNTAQPTSTQTPVPQAVPDYPGPGETTPTSLSYDVGYPTPEDKTSELPAVKLPGDLTPSEGTGSVRGRLVTLEGNPYFAPDFFLAPALQPSTRRYFG